MHKDKFLVSVQLMCTLKAHINHLFLEIFYGELKKLLKKLVIFSFFDKKISKIVYYFMSTRQ